MSATPLPVVSRMYFFSLAPPYTMGVVSPDERASSVKRISYPAAARRTNAMNGKAARIIVPDSLAAIPPLSRSRMLVTLRSFSTFSF